MEAERTSEGMSPLIAKALWGGAGLVVAFGIQAFQAGFRVNQSVVSPEQLKHEIEVITQREQDTHSAMEKAWQRYSDTNHTDVILKQDALEQKLTSALAVQSSELKVINVKLDQVMEAQTQNRTKR